MLSPVCRAACSTSGIIADSHVVVCLPAGTDHLMALPFTISPKLSFAFIATLHWSMEKLRRDAK